MIDFATLTLVDYGILLVLVLSCILSTLRGMTRELLGLIGWVVSYFIATYGAPIIEDSVVDFVQAKSLGQALAWGLPFATSVVVWFILASLIAPGLKRIGFGVLDRWFGVLFGVIRGFGLVLIAFAFFVYAAEGEKNLPETIRDAQSAPVLSRSAHYLAGFLPTELKDRLIDSLSYRPPLINGTASDSLDPQIDADKIAINTRMNLYSDEQAR
ncbi:MAG: CvpA family protein [Candidatus Puniceispirillaceae bacterium]